jgi:hypothetical protein
VRRIDPDDTTARPCARSENETSCCLSGSTAISESTEAVGQGPHTLLLQFGIVVGQSELWTHCTQAGAPPCWSQTGFAGSLQSLFIAQTTHSPRSSHTGSEDGQFEFCKHATHWLSVVLQRGVGAAQAALLVQPSRHVKSCGLQIGRAVPQSEFDRHSTHVWSPRKQRGAAAPQSEFARHATQRSVVASHKGRWVPAQSELVLQPMQSPVVVSQIVSAWLTWQLMFDVHAA